MINRLRKKLGKQHPSRNNITNNIKYLGVTLTMEVKDDERMDHLETAISRNPSHNQPPNADTIAHTSKILLKGP